MRVFYAIEFPEPVQSEFAALRNAVRDRMEKGSLTRTGNFHLTLRFIGEAAPVDWPALMRIGETAARSIRPFSLLPTGWGTFGKPGQSILWIGLRNDPSLLALQSAVEAAVQSGGYPGETKPFRPHVTIGRQVRLVCSTSELPDPVAGLPHLPALTVSGLSLMESVREEGMLVYRRLHWFPLMS